MIADLLWAALAVSCVLAMTGGIQRSGAALVVAGLLRLGISLAAMMSIGQCMVLIPPLEI